MKLTIACIPEGDQDLVHLCCAVGQLFSLFLSDIVAQSWYNPEGYVRIVDGSLAGQCYPKVKQLIENVHLS